MCVDLVSLPEDRVSYVREGNLVLSDVKEVDGGEYVCLVAGREDLKAMASLTVLGQSNHRRFSVILVI